ncbi:MAG: hypothetical protein ACRDGU_00925 [Actinomycetota bacterium]
MTEASGHGWALAFFPLLASLIAAVFGWRLLLRYLARRRPYEGVWAIALFMYAAASFAMALGVFGGWDAGEYRLYWLLGAVLNVPFLAQGELYLLARNRGMAHGLLLLLVLLSLASAWIVWAEPIRRGALVETLPLGREAWGDDSPAYQLRWLSWIGYFGLLAGTVWSAFKMRGRPELRDRSAGTVAIALGATVVAIGSGVGAGFDIVPLFSVSLAVGIALMFWGFLRASRPSVPGTTQKA